MAFGYMLRSRVKHTAAHPGFDAVASRIAQEQGVSIKEAKAILASRTRGASAAARHANPRLNRVRR